jgi:phenylacetate-coenzyme A ligase PaaK-like adenylate-forming protein
MVVTSIAQLRFIASMLYGVRFSHWSLETIIDAVQATQREFGVVGAEGAEFLSGPTLDDATRREVQQRRFRTQALRGARETAYYANLVAGLDLDPARLRFEDISRIPYTTKDVVRTRPEAFIRHSARPVFRSTTSGTTGWPTSIAFSDYEMRVSVALGALSLLNSGQIGPEDIVQLSTSSRALLGNLCHAGAFARIGAYVHMPGQLDPEFTLAMLREPHTIPGKKPRVSVLGVYPSYLGELVELGLARGYRPANFGVELITTGGEIVTAGLKRRCQALFGPVGFTEGFGMTEPWPFGGTLCPSGHLHFEPSAGLMEVRSLATGGAAAPGEAGTLVLTPFPPYRETTILLRYDTEDVVRPLAWPLSCSMRNQPATTHLLGKRWLAAQHDGDWTFPREVMEALEAVGAVPLPARFGFWAVPGGVAVEVVARDDTAETRRAIKQSLEAWSVPVRELHLLTDRRRLRTPYPLRGDLREVSFDTPGSGSAGRAAAVPWEQIPNLTGV